MPPPRRVSPRRSSRRSKSRSYSPKSSHRRSRSHSREKRRSRSPREKKKASTRHRSRSRSRGRRSRSYEVRRKSRSKTPEKLRGKASHKRSPSNERSYPVKRQADSTGKRHAYRSRSPSPAPVKKSKDTYRRKSESPEFHRKSSKHSPSPPKTRYVDEPTSSSSSRKRCDSKQRKDEIDYVTIIDLTPRQKLDKRFQTPEQKVQGPFDFDENITIGIHRGPHHLELDDDVPVNYNFNPKTFVMLHPKKDYRKAIFDRDEILAFKHDDILDEEAYVEKRTITVKPTDKKPSKYDQSDYKITVGADRDGDRRRVHDSGSRSTMSRKSSYDQDVTVRLDPKPDPRYEKLYRDQKRQDDARHEDDRIKRNPNDLRYNLMRRSDRDSDRDRDRDRSYDRPHSGDRGMMDARNKIQARRHDSQSDYRKDRRKSESPPRIERKKVQLPDFKNRPGEPLTNPDIWIIGTSVVKDLEKYTDKDSGLNLGEQLKDQVASITYHGEIDMKISDMLNAVRHMLKSHTPPAMIVFQCGENDHATEITREESEKAFEEMKVVKSEIPNVMLVWSQTLPQWQCPNMNTSTLDQLQRRINHFMMQNICSDEISGGIIYHTMLRPKMKHQYFNMTTDLNLRLTSPGMRVYASQLKNGLLYLISGKGSIFPYLKWPPLRISEIGLESFCMLNEEMIQEITEEMFNDMSKEQIQKLSSEQIEFFEPNQFSWLISRKFISSLTPEQLGKLSLFKFHLFTKFQIDLFQPEDVEKLSEDVRALIVKRKEKMAKHEEYGNGNQEYNAENYRGSSRGRGRFRGRGRPYIRGRGRGGFYQNSAEHWGGRGHDGNWSHDRRDDRERSRSRSRERHSYDSRRRLKKRRSRRRSRSSSSDSLSSVSSASSDYRRRSRSHERSKSGHSSGQVQAPVMVPFMSIPPPGIPFQPPISIGPGFPIVPPPHIPPPVLTVPSIPPPFVPTVVPTNLPPPSPFSDPPPNRMPFGSPPGPVHPEPRPFQPRHHFPPRGPHMNRFERPRGPHMQHRFEGPRGPHMHGFEGPRGPHMHRFEGPRAPHMQPNEGPPMVSEQVKPNVNIANLANLTQVATVESTRPAIKDRKEKSPSSSPDLYGDLE